MSVLHGFDAKDARNILQSTKEFDARSRTYQSGKFNDTVLWVKLTEQVTGGTDGKKWKAAVQDFDGTDHTDRVGATAFDDDTPVNIVGGGTAKVDDIVRAEIGGSVDNRPEWVAVVSSWL